MKNLAKFNLLGYTRRIMRLNIQDPTIKQTPMFDEVFLAQCKKAVRGAGIFAFATKSGVEVLLEDKTFCRMIDAGEFSLVVGVDEITNVPALEALSKLSKAYPGLTVSVFFHDIPNSTFHPKFCWFRFSNGAVLLTGSVNLTERALRNNWEAYTISKLNEQEAGALENQWNAWLASKDGFLRPMDDAEVIERAKGNIWKSKKNGKQGKKPAGKGQAAPDKVAPAAIRRRVLVAALPRAANRWNQANFNLDTFTNFFMAVPGEVHRISLRHVGADGVLGGHESRPSVAVKSRNFRFELDAARGLKYPDEGRPIAVFVELSLRTFRYRLLMPDDDSYQQVADFLNTEFTGNPNHLKRVVRDIALVKAAWPDSPLWQVDYDAID